MELWEENARPVPVTKGDVRAVLTTDIGLSDEGYRITVDADGCVTVEAGDETGLFYGRADVDRQIRTTGGVLPKVSAPDVAERALLLDVGRKYYTVGWIKDMIRTLADCGMNALVLHFSEEMGLGLESKLYPWLAGRDNRLCVRQATADRPDDGRYLTQDEVRDIAAFARTLHVRLVPSFDSPGHMNYIVKRFNDRAAAETWQFDFAGKTYTVPQGADIGNYYHYDGKTAIVQGSRNPAFSRGIDISDPLARAFAASLVSEYAAFFREIGSTDFDIGGDELLGWGASLVEGLPKWQQLEHWQVYARARAHAEGRARADEAVAYDGFLYYLNDTAALVRSFGYRRVRVWNDDVLRSADTGWTQVVELDRTISVQYWSPTSPAGTDVQTYLDAGYEVFNYLNCFNYYVVGAPELYPRSTPEELRANWSPYVFSPTESEPGQGVNPPVGDARVHGSGFCVWADDPLAPLTSSEERVREDLLPRLAAHGARAWGRKREE